MNTIFTTETITNRIINLRNHVAGDPERKKMVCIHPNQAGFIVKGPVDTQTAESLRLIKGCRSETGSQARIIPFTFTACAKLLTWMETHGYYFQREAAPKMIETLDLKVDGLCCTLKPYQYDSLFFALEHEKVLLGYEDGFGKAGVALAAIQFVRGPALIVTTVDQKEQWKSEIAEMLPGKSVCILNGGKTRDIETSDIVIVNYEVLSKWLVELSQMGFSVVIFDESLALKNGKAQCSQAARNLALDIPYNLLLTGKRIEEHPIDFWGQLVVMDKAHNLFHTFKQFEGRYCDGHEAFRRDGGKYTEHNGATYTRELLGKLKDCYLYYRNTDMDLGSQKQGA
jgi:hypothetical protein